MTTSTPAPTLKEQLDGMTAAIPEAIGTRIDAGVAEIEASRAAPGLAVGDRAPAFTLPDALGRPVSLADLRANGPVVVIFYRGEWCPYCNLQLRALQAALPAIRELGASLVAISPQAPDHSLSLTEKHALAFPVLSDSTRQRSAPTASSSRSPATSRTSRSTSSRTTRPTKTPTTAVRSPSQRSTSSTKTASSEPRSSPQTGVSGPNRATSSPRFGR